MYSCGQVQTIDRTASSIIALDRKQRAVDLGLRPIIRPCLFILRSIKALFQLRQDFLDDAGMLNTGEPLVQASELVCETFVVNAETMENCGVDVANMRSLILDVVGPQIGLAPVESSFDAAAGHPDRKAAPVMVTPCTVRTDPEASKSKTSICFLGF